MSYSSYVRCSLVHKAEGKKKILWGKIEVCSQWHLPGGYQQVLGDDKSNKTHPWNSKTNGHPYHQKREHYCPKSTPAGNERFCSLGAMCSLCPKRKIPKSVMLFKRAILTDLPLSVYLWPAHLCIIYISSV